jgi:hypothetical protein
MPDTWPVPVKRHQRHGAVVPGPHGDAVVIEEAADVIGVMFAEVKGNHPLRCAGP